MQAARLGLALSVALTLTGSAVVAQRAAAPRASGGAALLTSSKAVPPPTPAPAAPLACHDQPVATQAAGSSVAVPLKSPAVEHAPAPPTTTATPATAAPAPPPAQSDAGGCHPTPDQVAAAQKLVADTRSAIVSRYAHVSDAALAGYQPSATDKSSSSRVSHYTNYRYWHDDSDILDPAKPEGLLYGQTDHHGLVLVGAFYLMPQPGEHGPEIGGCLTHWHTHHAGDAEMLHVWIVDMPGGPFTDDWDPSYIAGL